MIPFWTAVIHTVLTVLSPLSRCHWMTIGKNWPVQCAEPIWNTFNRQMKEKFIILQIYCVKKCHIGFYRLIIWLFIVFKRIMSIIFFLRSLILIVIILSIFKFFGMKIIFKFIQIILLNWFSFVRFLEILKIIIFVIRLKRLLFFMQVHFVIAFMVVIRFILILLSVNSFILILIFILFIFDWTCIFKSSLFFLVVRLNRFGGFIIFVISLMLVSLFHFIRLCTWLQILTL